MINLSPAVCQKFKMARIAKGLNQSALARAVGCKQSAISMFEGGMCTKLSDETVKKMAEFLGVEIEERKEERTAEERSAGQESGVPAVGRGYCPNCNCPSNVPYVVDGRVFYRPSRGIASPAVGTRCAVCGEMLEMRCPNCGAPLNDGACCTVCGAQYVTPVLPEGIDGADYAAVRREEIRQLRELI